MELVSILVATITSFLFGAIWYTFLAKPWMVASGVALDESGQPANRKSPFPYLISLIGTAVVAAMIQHIFARSGIVIFFEGLVSGLGLGLFVAVPWLATNYGFAGRPFRLILIDGGYATIGCMIIGAVLTLF
ncbi:MAG: DUF1761 domain-containing protein [Paracoccaceae bacterium]